MDASRAQDGSLRLKDLHLKLRYKRLSKGRFPWWPTGTEPARTLESYQAQLLIAAGNPDTAAAPMWRRVS
jgi:transposase